MPGPTLDEMRAAQEALRGQVIETPVLPLASDRWEGILPDSVTATVKLELFQQTGSFKARGALLGIASLTEAQREIGVVAASGGNHALAVAWAARAAGARARIAMPEATDPLRIDGCKAMGADVVLCADMAAAFAEMEKGAEDGRFLMHPFEGPHMTLGAATCGLEYLAQAPEVETFVVPVGGGGLISGIAAAVKAVRPDAQIIGVEPFGADSLTRSLAAGHPVKLDRVDTIADSLGAPKAMPYSLSLAQAFVDEMVQISDDAMREAMRHYRDVLRIIAEPACAASLAALCGPLRDRLAGQHVGIIACGSNIGMARYLRLLGEDR